MPNSALARVALAFQVADVPLALRVQDVREVVPMVALEQAPELPPLVHGLLALGRERVPVLDLPQLLRLPGAGASREMRELNGYLIVARYYGRSLAWRSAGEAQLITYRDADTVALPPDHVLNGCAQRLIGQAPPAPSPVLLEVDRLLLEEERVRLEGWAARQAERVAAFTVTT